MTNEELDKLSAGGRQQAYAEVAKTGGIGTIFALDLHHRHFIKERLRNDQEARFNISLTKQATANLKKGQKVRLRDCKGSAFELGKGETREVGFKNASHLYYTYGPQAPVESHRGLIECAGRANVEEINKQKAKKQKQAEDLLAEAKAEKEEAMKALAEAKKLKEEIEAAKAAKG
jgi:hypothetical protein